MKRISTLILAIVMTISCAFCVSPISAFADDTQCSHENTEVINQKDANGTEDGYTGDVYCNDCQKVITEGSIIHNYNDGVFTKMPTCSKDGEKVYTCKVCNHQYTEVVEKSEQYHHFVDTHTPATCTAWGTQSKKCTICDSGSGNVLSDEPPLGHTWERKYKDGEIDKTVKTVVKPTCTEEGYTLEKCGDCDAERKTSIVSPLGHSYVGVVTTKQTATTNGLMTYKCKNCNNSYTQVIPAGSVIWTYYDGNCVFIKDGLTPKNTPVEIIADGNHKTHKICSYYWSGCYEKRNEVEGNCSYSSDITKDATCTEDGETTYTCSVCKDTYTENEPKATGEHKYQLTNTVNPTCTNDGLKTYMCSVCGDNYTEPIDKLGHSYTSAVTHPSCTEQGYTTHTCSRCNDSYKDNYVDAKGHSWDKGVETKPATQTTDGEITYTCTVCHEIKTAIIPANGTKWTYFDGTITACEDGVTPENTADNYEPSGDGSNHKKYNYYWEGTQEKRNEEIDKCSLDSGVITTEATCGVAGVKTYTCGICGYQYTVSIPATGQHQYNSEITTPATCTEDGVKTYTCKVCGHQYTEVISKLGHNYQTKITAPNCTNGGYSTHICSRCGDSYIDSRTEPLGHQYYVSSVVAPTCYGKGYTLYKCAVCDDTQKRDNTEMIAHSYKLDKNSSKRATTSANGYRFYRCSNSGCTATKKETVYSIKTISISKTNIYYTGKNLSKPTIKVVDSKGKTISSSNYVVTYISRATNKSFSTLKGIGRYKVKVTFKTTSDYSASVYKYFSVIPAKETIRSLSTGKGYISAKWNKQSYASGYYVMIATNSKFTSNKRTYTCTKNTKTSIKMTSLKRGKKYYIKVCSYRNCKVDGKTQRVYGTYSAVKTIKCK